MNEDSLLNELNTIIKEEGGHSINSLEKLVDSGIDSFDFTMILIAIDHKYGIYPKEEFSKLNFAELTPKEIIERILQIHGNK